MDKKTITPNPNQPIDRVPSGQLPSALAELTEVPLSGTHVLTSEFYKCNCYPVCPGCTPSYYGDEE